MNNSEKTIQISVVVIGFLLLLEIFGIFESEIKNGYSEKEVELMIQIKELNNKIDNLKAENEIIEKDNEKLQTEIPLDSAVVWNSHRLYRDSLRSAINPS